ncbi:MAG: UDP-2,3-diacylglucosamine diphosphatase [Bacteroidales bacterium]|nr:UDP-2,3-diacylglucosamine diphosphatase [Candidatus Equimonas enterica]
MKPIYFISDAHLGSLATKSPRMQERCLVNFLDSIKHKAAAVYMLGDMFDFWHEYRTVVPKGFTRFLGKISELTDRGVEVHFFTGNHDLWVGDYMETECGVTLHRESAETIELYDKLFFLAHGDGLGRRDRKFLLLRSIFHNRVCQRLFAAIHPRWGVAFGLSWARHSRLKRIDGTEPPYQGENNEPLVIFAKAYMQTHPDIDYFIFGHRHIELDLMLSHTTRLLLLGDWLQQFTYAVFDGEHMYLENYLEGETEP